MPDDYRRLKTWPIYLSGGQMEFILPEYLGTDEFVSYEQLWNETWFARRFLEENAPFWEMEPADDLLEGESGFSNGRRRGGMSGQVLAKAGDTYVVYLPNASSTGTLNLSDAPGQFTMRWYNPRAGAFEGTSTVVEGGGPVALGVPPTTGSDDWTVLLRAIP